MITSGFLQTEPAELQFPFELKKQISCSVQLTNKSDNYVAFKMKTTNLKKYCVRPNMGIVMPNSSCDVTVTMQAQQEAPPFMQCSDKFLIQSVVVSPGVTEKDITPKTFNKETGKQVDECKLKVVYVVPPQVQPPSLVQRRIEMSASRFLQIEPAELQFPFELKKQISCSMQLRNKSADNYLAFKIKTTDPKKYCVKPNTGIMMPNSSCDVKVTMRTQKEAPPFMQCSDKFLIQSVVLSPGVIEKYFTPKTFNKETEEQVDECKLKVTYVMPPQVQPPSPVQRKRQVDFKIKARNLHVSSRFCNLQVSCFSSIKKVTI